MSEVVPMETMFTVNLWHTQDTNITFTRPKEVVLVIRIVSKHHVCTLFELETRNLSLP